MTVKLTDEREEISFRWSGDVLRIEATVPATVAGLGRLRQMVELYMPTVEAAEKRRDALLSPEADQIERRKT